MAAGTLIAAEAGARVGGLAGSSMNNGVLAASAQSYDDLASVLTELGAHLVFAEPEA